MTFRRYIVRNVLRNKRRAALMVLSIGFSFFLLMILLTFLGILLNPIKAEESSFRLIVSRSTSLAEWMPLAYGDKIRRLPDVERVVPFQWFNGIYQDPKNFFANFATDPEHIWDVYSEQKVSAETKAAFIAERTAAVVGEELIKRYGWKVGDRVTLLGTIFPADLEFKIVGRYTANEGENNFYFRYDYFNEAIGRLNMVGSFVVKARRPEAVPEIAEAIDAMFRNSAAETKTQTEKAFVLGFVSMLGNVKSIVAAVGLVVVFTMLLVTVSTMAMAIRERLREMAVLRALGYSRRIVFWLIQGESLFMASLGTACGLGMAESLRLVNMDAITQGFVEKFSPAPWVYAVVLSTGLGIGLVSGLAPAAQASRVNITAAMRSVE